MSLLNKIYTLKSFAFGTELMYRTIFSLGLSGNKPKNMRFIGWSFSSGVSSKVSRRILLLGREVESNTEASMLVNELENVPAMWGQPELKYILTRDCWFNRRVILLKKVLESLGVGLRNPIASGFITWWWRDLRGRRPYPHRVREMPSEVCLRSNGELCGLRAWICKRCGRSRRRHVGPSSLHHATPLVMLTRYGGLWWELPQWCFGLYCWIHQCHALAR